MSSRENSPTSDISTATSLRTTNSFVSASGELLADSYMQERESANEDSLLDTGQKYLTSSSLDPITYQNSCSVDNRNLKEIKIVGTVVSPERTEADVYGFKSEKEKTTLSHSVDNEIIWLLPEPEYAEDDMEGSVANNDDDDEYSDGTQWGQPSSLNVSFAQRSCKLKEEVQREMRLRMKGKFKRIVRLLLESNNIIFSTEVVNNWVDVVTSLALEAVFSIKSYTSGTLDLKKQLKVKCIISGLCSESQLINGLVFKKNASHKHMPTKYENPKLLLLEELHGHSSSELSSFDSMEQENGNLKSLIEKIEMCHPDVVLVAGTVSRDVQDSLLAKRIVLVFDMKLHRLERIARYTGSEIFSSPNSLICQKLKLCQSFHFERFEEEHAISKESEKKRVKTLMFLKGCRGPGFTILLKGAHSVEQKKIKFVVYSAVRMAYHLMLESSFHVDQRTMLSTIRSMEVVISSHDQLPIVSPSIVSASSLEKSLPATASSLAIEVPFPDVAEEASSCEGSSSNFNMDLKRCINLSCVRSNVNSFQEGSNQTYGDSTYSEIEIKDSADVVGSVDGELSGSISACHEVPVLLYTVVNYTKLKEDVNTCLDPESIVYLESAQNLSNNKICKKRRFCRVKYYQNFDTSLGHYLRDTLLNQCLACNDPPQAHVYNYVHRNGKLTVRCKQLPANTFMHGEAEGKLWMWAHCSECERMGKTQGSTRRVVMSLAAQSLSFGKFLEHSFSAHSACNRLPDCGHSLQADHLHFYGLGRMVAMFTYSAVNMYMVCMPPPILEFKNPSSWIKDEAESVRKKVMLLFTKVENLLQTKEYAICNSNSNPSMNQIGLLHIISEVKGTLKQEKYDFEEQIQEILNENEHMGKTVHGHLSSNSLIQKLVHASHVWDQRLQNLLSSDCVKVDINGTHRTMLEEVQLPQQRDGIDDLRVEERAHTSQHVSDDPEGEGYKLHISLGPDDSIMSVYEGEPTSIIACALAWLHGKHSSTGDVAEKEIKIGNVDFKGAIESADSLDSDVSVVSPKWSSNGSLDSYGIQGESVSSEDSYASFIYGSNLVDQTQNPHIEIHLGTEDTLRKGKYSVLCLHEKQFHSFRRRCCPCELDYISSLSRCKKWEAKGGKSGSLFVKTLDGRFIIKEIQRTEFDTFSKFGQEYFKYTDQCFDSGNQTCLAKILGIYQVTIRQPKSGKDKKNLMVMENLFFCRNITRIYDLKGLQHLRYSKDLDSGGNVFLDKNFVEDMNLSPLYLDEKANRLLKRAVWNDTCFLSSINVMDYSLLVGVDEQRLELVCGIIDYLRQYTWDKQIETLTKTSLLVPKNETPTVIPPKEYKKRFRKFMDMHFLRIPDHN